MDDETHLARGGRNGLQLWGGVECTVNRVGDCYFDQLERSGHDDRPSDLSAFADLGIRAIRYPVLWERVAPAGPESADWSWTDDRLARLRDLDIRVIAGLTHHGSGPRHTSLVGPTFATELADYARQVAQRYPWIDDFTPVNEPLTTARFSGLYGLWYPHGRDNATFARALVNQCRAVCLAMQAIREVNPRARLVQTEDLGRTFAAPSLTAMADFYNERRWLSLDLLCGRVTADHPLHGALLEWGIGVDELRWHARHPCPPDLIGVNHYASSDRYLDDAVDRYEGWTCGVTPQGVPFVDIEAVRGCADASTDAASLVEAVWERYSLPVAITEAHLGATREEQLRWLQQMWDGAAALRARGVDVQAVTVWALLGSFDWNVLVTAQNGAYEPGPLDVRSSPPRCTALGELMRDLAAGRSRADDPLLNLPGWWQRPQRLYRPDQRGAYRPPPAVHARRRVGRPLLIVGADSALGVALSHACEMRGIPWQAVAAPRCDGAEEFGRIVSSQRPWGMVDATAFGSLGLAGTRDVSGGCRDAAAARVLAQVCRRHDARLVSLSSDLVFEAPRAPGSGPYVESDPVAPRSPNGRSAAARERAVLEAMPAALLVRSGPMIDLSAADNFVSGVLWALRNGHAVRVVTDEILSPTAMRDVVDAALDLLIDGERGVWHLAAAASLSPYALAGQVAAVAGLSDVLIEPESRRNIVPAWQGPRYAALASERGVLLRSLEHSLERWVHEAESRMGHPTCHATTPAAQPEPAIAR